MDQVPAPRILITNPEAGQYGPGHNSFTVIEDNKQDVLMYHARSYKEITGNPLYDSNRHTRAKLIDWNDNGEPVFGEPLRD